MNDLNKPLKDGAGVDEKRLSRRPMWRSLKLVTTKIESPVEPSSIAKTMDPPPPSTNIEQTRLADEGSITAPSTTTPNLVSIQNVDDKKNRLSSWLNQQLYEHQAQTHISPSWIDEREPATISNLSVVSHASSINNDNATHGRQRSSSVPTSPTTTPHLVLQLVDHPFSTNNNSITPPLSPPPQLRLEKPAPPVATIYASSTTASTMSDHSPLTTPAIMDDHSFTHSFGTLPLPAVTTAIDLQEESRNCINHIDNDDNDDEDDDDDDDDDDDTYTTASGTSSLIDDTENQSDKNDNASSNSRPDIHQNTSSNNDDDNEINSTPPMDNDNDNQLGGRKPKNRTSSMQALYTNSIMDAMDPEVAQVLLEWRRQSLLNIDWFDLFSVKSEIWRSSTLFPLYSTQLTPSSHQQLDRLSSTHSSIDTSIISLDYKGISLEKAFRSYSNKIDYANANALEIDQALKVFAQLYWECNPNPLLRCAELVYIVTHALMLLVTDIHAGGECITADDFCNSTINLILDHQASIPFLSAGTGGESDWRQSIIEYLQSLYKSFSRSSLSLGQSHLPPNSILCYQQHHHHRERKQEQYPNQEPVFGDRLEVKYRIREMAAFDNMFINTIESPDNRTPARHKQLSLAPQKKQKRKRRRRSKSLNSPPSWTLVRRRDTQRAKVGPYKEGPLSCQLSGEQWKVCWVILHHGHLYVYHHKDGAPEEHPLTPTMASTSSVSLEIGNRNKLKKKFMHHITSASTHPISPAVRRDQLNKKEPYQAVDIYLGNAFCEKIRPHSFLLQLANGNSYVFDCGSENQVALWIQDCNYWAARETKVVLSRGSLAPSSSSSAAIMVNDSSLLAWKRPPPPAGASVLDMKGQQEAIDTHLLYLKTELKTHLQYEPGSTALPVWHDKKLYLELETKKYQCYHDSLI